MKIRKNGKVINLSESDLRRIVKRVITEQKDDKSWWEEMKQDANYIKDDIVRAFGETSEIPASFGKLFNYVTSQDYSKIAGDAFEQAKKDLYNDAKDVWNTVSGWFNESYLAEQEGEMGPIAKYFKSVKDKKRLNRVLKNLKKFAAKILDKE